MRGDSLATVNGVTPDLIRGPAAFGRRDSGTQLQKESWTPDQVRGDEFEWREMPR